MAQKIFSGADLPLTTSNAALAFCLYIAGIPFQDDNHPLSNVYDAETLRKLGYERTPIEEAVGLAFAAGKKGTVEYGFKKALRIGEALEGFTAVQKLLAASDIKGADIVLETMRRHAGGLLSLPEALSGAACAVLKTWREELKLWEGVKRFTAQQQRNRKNDSDARETAEKVFLAGEPFAFLAVIMDARAVFLDLHKKFPPIIRLHRAGSVSSQKLGRNTLAKHPGFAFYTPETSNEIRKDLGVPRR